MANNSNASRISSSPTMIMRAVLWLFFKKNLTVIKKPAASRRPIAVPAIMLNGIVPDSSKNIDQPRCNTQKHEHDCEYAVGLKQIINIHAAE